MANIAIALLIYPGIGLALVLALLFAWLTEQRFNFGRWPSAGALATFDGLAACASAVLAAVALALLPWPYHPASGWRLIGQPIALWSLLEGAFLIGQMPGLIAPAPLAARAAARDLQMSVAGRFVLWLAVGVGLWGGAGWSLATLPGRLLIGLAGALALPAAIGSGPFGPERSLSAAGAEAGLDEGVAGLVRFARAVRAAAALAALVVATLPPSAGAAPPGGLVAGPQLQPWIVILLIVAVFVVIALVLRQITLAMPRLTLPAALRWCWWRALPLAVAGLIYLVVI